MPVARTNLKRDLGNTYDSLCNWVQLSDVKILARSKWKYDDLPQRRQRQC